MWELFITIILKQEKGITSRFHTSKLFQTFPKLTTRQAGWHLTHSPQPISHTQGPSQALRHRKPHICSAELCTITRVAAHSWRSFRDLSSPAQGLGTALGAKITPGNIYSSTGYCIQHPRAHKSRRLFINTDFFWHT